MNLADSLLKQSRLLMMQDKRRPQQASLRRATSTAYYALFHLLTEDAAKRLISGASNKPLRQQTQRAFDHAVMRQCCRTFSGGSLPAFIAPLLVSRPSPALQKVANVFATLQEARHVADYDTAQTYSRREAETLVVLAEEAFAAWRTIRAADEARVFCVSLLLWRQWNRT